MNPQGGEGNNNQPPASTAVEPNVGVPSNPLDKLEGVVAAAELEAAQAAPGQTPAETQFTTQFGGVAPPVESTPVTPSPAESVPDLMGQALAGLETTLPPSVGEDISANVQPPPETVQQLEQTPADRLKQEISASVDAFLEKVLQKEGVTS